MEKKKFGRIDSGAASRLIFASSKDDFASSD